MFNSANGLHCSLMTPHSPQFTLGKTTAAVLNQITDTAVVSGTTKTDPNCTITSPPPQILMS